jgi:hypothetical protein
MELGCQVFAGNSFADHLRTRVASYSALDAASIAANYFANKYTRNR